MQLRAELHVELVESVQRPVDHRDIGLEPHRHARGVGAGDSATEDHHFGGRHAGHAAQQHAHAALLLLEAVRADLDRHAARDLAHGRQQRQTTARVRHGLVSDRGNALARQSLRLRLVGGEVQIGEEHLAVAQQRDLLRLRLLHLDHEIGLSEDCRGIR